MSFLLVYFLGIFPAFTMTDPVIIESEYKAFHEKFMQNHNGTTAVDAFITVVPNFFTTCILKQIILWLGVSSDFYKLCLEYVILIIPIMLGTTVLAEFRFIWLLISMIVFVLLHSNQLNLKLAWSSKIDRRRKWQCISYIRSLTLLVTAFSILAVDFNIFPRFLAKTEKYGYSYMDLGVGLFIFCNALVPAKVSRHSLMKSLEFNYKQCGMLLLLGAGRAFVTKEIDYQQHTTEYGVHWNFFITLAVTKMVATIVMCIFKERNSLVCGLALLTIHEVALQNKLSSWVFSEMSRTNFLTSNREGIVSCAGYIALYLISSYIGQIIREKYSDTKEGSVISSLLLITCVSWLGVYFSPYLGVSRCLANMGYCCFVIAVGTTHLTLFYLYEINEIAILRRESKSKKPITLCGGYAMPIIYSAINENGLLFFLLCNIMTGLVNLCFHTLYLDAIKSFSVLTAYMIFVVLVIVGFQKKGDSLMYILRH